MRLQMESGNQSELEIWHEHLIFPLIHWWKNPSEANSFLDNLLSQPMDDKNPRAGFSPEVFSELFLLLQLSRELEAEKDMTDFWASNNYR